MASLSTSCIRVSDTRRCPLCMSLNIIKNGFTKNKKQQYYCKSCKKRSIEYYTYQAYIPTINHDICSLIKEGTGIRSMARLLRISTNTIFSRLTQIVRTIRPPAIAIHKSYEVDEMRTFIRKKDRPIWIVYALERESKKVVLFHIGRRTIGTIRRITDTLILSQARKICTDKLNIYRCLIPQQQHCTRQYAINHIERNNLTLRTHIKRLHRRSICFSKTVFILSQILNIYFWG